MPPHRAIPVLPGSSLSHRGAARGSQHRVPAQGSSTPPTLSPLILGARSALSQRAREGEAPAVIDDRSQPRSTGSLLRVWAKLCVPEGPSLRCAQGCVAGQRGWEAADFMPLLFFFLIFFPPLLSKGKQKAKLSNHTQADSTHCLGKLAGKSSIYLHCPGAAVLCWQAITSAEQSVPCSSSSSSRHVGFLQPEFAKLSRQLEQHSAVCGAGICSSCVCCSSCMCCWLCAPTLPFRSIFAGLCSLEVPLFAALQVCVRLGAGEKLFAFIFFHSLMRKMHSC